MDKVDLFKEHKAEYEAKGKPALVEIGPATYLAIAGSGAPGSEAFTDRIGALYGMAFTIKMTRKFAGEGDYTVGKLEAQYWQGDESRYEWGPGPPEQWRWRLMIRTPDVVTATDRKEAIAVLSERGKGKCVAEVELRTVKEGLCVQMLHVGPYDRECETIAAMEERMQREGLARAGLHHDIYLNDPRRIPPERLKTIVRIPVRKG